MSTNDAALSTKRGRRDTRLYVMSPQINVSFAVISALLSGYLANVSSRPISTLIFACIALRAYAVVASALYSVVHLLADLFDLLRAGQAPIEQASPFNAHAS